MPQIRNTVMLQGAPLRIWSALVDRDQRRAWRPLIEVDDPDRLGRTRCAFTVNGWSRAIRTGAVVEYLDKPRCFAWRCGLRFVLELEERFELEGDDGGARLTHSLTMKGALAYLFVSFLRARLHDLLVETDGRFAGYLRWRFAHPVRSGADRSGLAWRYKGRGR